MKFEIFSRKPLLRRRQWYFHILAKNGRVIAQSEGYNNFNDCLDIVTLISQSAGTAEVTIFD